MKLKIPPALQFIIFALFMYGIAKLAGSHFFFKFQDGIAILCIILAIIVGLSAVFSFRKARTSVNPLKPSKATQLVTLGLYQYSRNPMYLAMLLGLIAVFIKFGNYYNSIILVLYVWYITTFQIKPEEKVLTEIFGVDFINYCKKVRRWI